MEFGKTMGFSRHGFEIREREGRTIELSAEENKEFDTWIRQRIWEACGKVVPDTDREKNTHEGDEDFPGIGSAIGESL